MRYFSYQANPKMKKITAASIAIIALLFLAACGEPVPPEKSSYVGTWQGDDLHLEIIREGSINYEDTRDGRLKISGAPLKEFNEEGLDVGVGFISMTVNVDEPPFQEGDQWKMVVDGVTLTRASEE